MEIVVMLMSALAMLFGQDHRDRTAPPVAPREVHGAPAPGLVAGVPAVIAALGALGLVGVTGLRRRKSRYQH